MRFTDRPEAAESLRIAALPERIWPVVSDIGFVVGTSKELLSVEWVTGDGTDPFVGRQFRGTNSNQWYGTWDTTATVVECDAPVRFGWVVGDVERPNTTWRFTLEPDGDGTLVTQWVRVGPGPSGLVMAIERYPEHEERIVADRMREFGASMQANLEALRTRVEAG